MWVRAFGAGLTRGHQFGYFVPQHWATYRANLLGEVVGRDGVRYDIQLKGSGPTPFSRRGDGRAALGPVLREYLVSEAMAALGAADDACLLAAVNLLAQTGGAGDACCPEQCSRGLRRATCAWGHSSISVHGAMSRVCAPWRIIAIARHYPEAAQAGTQLYRAFVGGHIVTRQARLVAAMDADRLYPWRDEHRQHVDLGRVDCLRCVRVYGGQRSESGLQLHSTCKGVIATAIKAARRPLEPRAPGGSVAALAGAGDRE